MKTKQLQSLIILNGLAVTLTPTNIQIIGDLAADEPLGGDAQARMITRFAQRSMMHNLIPRNYSSDLIWRPLMATIVHKATKSAEAVRLVG